MAISPNTDFTTGAVFTADQANRFPRGVMALTESIGSPSNFSTEAVVLTGSSFTAVATAASSVTVSSAGAAGAAGAASSVVTAAFSASGVAFSVEQAAKPSSAVATAIVVIFYIASFLLKCFSLELFI